MAIAIANIRVTDMIMFYLQKKAMKSSTFQIRKVRGIVPGGCLHQREVRLAQVSCGIVAGKFNSKFVQSLSCRSNLQYFRPKPHGTPVQVLLLLRHAQGNPTLRLCMRGSHRLSALKEEVKRPKEPPN